MAITKLSWEKATPAPLVLISGPFELTAHRALAQIKARLRQDHPDLEVTEADAQSYHPGQLLDWASPSLFNEPKLIVIDNVHTGNDAFFADALELVKAEANPDVTFVFRHEKGVRGKKFLTAIRDSPDAVEIVNPAPRKAIEKHQLVLQLFAAARRRPGQGAAELLLEAFAESLEELDAAVSQLVRDVDGEITREDAQRYFGGRIETTAFQVADAAIQGRTAQAVLLLRQTLASGVPGVLLLGAFGNKLRLMAKVYDAPRGSAKVKLIGAAPWQIDNARKDLRRWSERKLAMAISKLAETDAALKGEAKSPEYALERFVIEVASK